MRQEAAVDTEVLVVGASLVGLIAAETAAASGARTLLVEAAPQLGARANPANLIMAHFGPTRCPWKKLP